MQSLHDRLADLKTRPRPADPVRIALVITDLDIGGAERAMVNLATRLNRTRWAAKVFALGGEGRLARNSSTRRGCVAMPGMHAPPAFSGFYQARPSTPKLQARDYPEFSLPRQSRLETGRTVGWMAMGRERSARRGTTKEMARHCRTPDVLVNRGLGLCLTRCA